MRLARVGQKISVELCDANIGFVNGAQELARKDRSFVAIGCYSPVLENYDALDLRWDIVEVVGDEDDIVARCG